MLSTVPSLCPAQPLCFMAGEVVKQEMTRVNNDILGISEIKWTRMGGFNSDDNVAYVRQFNRRAGHLVFGFSRSQTLRKSLSKV